MTKTQHLQHVCSICEKIFPAYGIVSGELVRKEIAREIKQTCPEWDDAHFICHADLALMRSRYIQTLLVSEESELTTLEQTVLQSLNEHELISTNIETEFDQKWTFGEKLADKIASFGGSWLFLIFFGLFITFWITTNSVVFWFRPSDPYPFIFLNLILSCVASIQAPVIMMSQNRTEAKDRVRSQHDYKINLKAELEIRSLHEKMDHLLSHQWEKMVKIQQLQLEMLSELNSRDKLNSFSER